jgi:hypothetical protein
MTTPLPADQFTALIAAVLLSRNPAPYPDEAVTKASTDAQALVNQLRTATRSKISGLGSQGQF